MGRGTQLRTRTLRALAICALVISTLTLGGQPAGAAGAINDRTVLILSTTVTGGINSREAQAAVAAGYTVEMATAAQWAAKTATDFATYRALILGDPTCQGSGGNASSAQAAINNRAVWSPIVNGNVIINGTDPVFHHGRGGSQMTTNSVRFAADVPLRTGLYASMSCYYHGVGTNVAIPLLDLIGIGPRFKARGVGCFNNAHIVATHPALVGMTDASLSNWSCSVHNAFDSWPTDFLVLAIARNTGSDIYTASDGSRGVPYVLARGEGLIPIGNITLTPSVSTQPAGTARTFTVEVREDGTPRSGRSVTFTVGAGGPNAGFTATGATGSLGTVNFTINSATAGTDSATARYTDPGGVLRTSNTATTTWTSTNRAPTASANGPYSVPEGGSVGLTGSGSDPDGDPLTYSWDLDNNGSFETAGQSPTFSAAGRDGPGSQTVVLKVCDNKGACATSSATVTITNVAPTIVAVSNNGPVDEPASATISVTATDPAGALDPLAYSFDCDNDGIYEIGPQSASTAGCSYPDDGTYQVNVLVTDGDGGSATGSTTVSVPNVAPTIHSIANSGPIDEGTSASINVTATDPAGAYDPLTYAFDCQNDTAYEVGPAASSTASCFFDDNGSFPVGVRVDDGDGGTTDGMTTVVVNNVAPTPSASNSSPQYWGLPIAFTGSATDPSKADTLAGFGWFWTFGDGGTANTQNASHAYANPGTYTATLATTDKDGGTGNTSTSAVVTTRPTALSCTNASVAFGFGGTFSARLTDIVDSATALLAGNIITFSVSGSSANGVTDGSGQATAATASLMPGAYTVTVSFASSNLYDASQGTCTLTVENTPGKITGGGFRAANDGRGGFNAKSEDGIVLSGELQFQSNATWFHAHTITALAVSPDGTKAWFAGVGSGGLTFTAYVEDNGEPGDDDVWQLWIAGSPNNGDGQLSGGTIQIH